MTNLWQSAIDIDSLPKRGKEGGDVELEDWLESMVDHFGPVPEATDKVSTMETRMFPEPPDIACFGSNIGTVDEYLDDLVAWVEKVQSKVHENKIVVVNKFRALC